MYWQSHSSGLAFATSRDRTSFQRPKSASWFIQSPSTHGRTLMPLSHPQLSDAHSLVGILTALQTGRPRNHGSILGGGNRFFAPFPRTSSRRGAYLVRSRDSFTFLSFPASRPSLGPTQTPSQRVQKALSPGVKLRLHRDQGTMSYLSRPAPSRGSPSEDLNSINCRPHIFYFPAFNSSGLHRTGYTPTQGHLHALE
jgi:hypothetical protein